MSGYAIARIEFVGGPFDGHRQKALSHEIKDVVWLTVSRSLMCQLAGEPGSSCEHGRRVTSIAEYVLDTGNVGAILYRHVRNFAPAPDDCSVDNVFGGQG